MKKIRAMLLMAAMMTTMAFPASAESEGSGSISGAGGTAGGTGDIPVYGMVDYDGDGVPDDDGPASVIAVDLEWTSMTFTYMIDEYDSDNMSYTGSWKSGESGKIYVANRSNVAIYVEPVWEVSVKNLDLSLTAPFTLAKACIRNDGTPGYARRRTITVKEAEGEDVGISEGDTRLGTIKVHIREA